MKLFIYPAKILLLLFLLCSCATRQAPPLHIKTGERSTLAFTGKGVAAGMMMDAYMPGMGVAIGIAIDEGIAKDIAANLARYPAGFTIESLVQKHLLAQHVLRLSGTGSKNTAQVIIDTYGFRTLPGAGDKVTAWLKIRYVNKTGEVILAYPERIQMPEAFELADIKTNPDLAYAALDNALKILVAHWPSASSL